LRVKLLSSNNAEFDPQRLIDSFLFLVEPHIGDVQLKLEWDFWDAPHSPKPLRSGCGAVYIFAMAESVPNGFSENRVIKVGKVGGKSNARFQSQHYGFSAPSTVAKAIYYNPVIWPLFGFQVCPKNTVGQWLKAKTRRWNFYLYDTEPRILSYLEVYLKAILGPALEGVNAKETE
jgi:hypothetical protein